MTRRGWLLVLGLVMGSVSVGGCGGELGDLRMLSVGHVGCPAEQIRISSERDRGRVTSWMATCGGVDFLCSGGTHRGVSCTEARSATSGSSTAVASTAGSSTEVTPRSDGLLIRDLPPEVAECIPRPVAIEVLFGVDGRAQELRPWPGETPEQRSCVARVMVEVDAPSTAGGPVLVRFEPRDPWDGSR